MCADFFFHFCTKRHYVCEDVIITGSAASEVRPQKHGGLITQLPLS